MFRRNSSAFALEADSSSSFCFRSSIVSWPISEIRDPSCRIVASSPVRDGYNLEDVRGILGEENTVEVTPGMPVPLPLVCAGTDDEIVVVGGVVVVSCSTILKLASADLNRLDSLSDSNCNKSSALTSSSKSNLLLTSGCCVDSVWVSSESESGSLSSCLLGTRASNKLKPPLRGVEARFLAFAPLSLRLFLSSSIHH